MAHGYGKTKRSYPKFEPESEISDLITKLWYLDKNCCYNGQDYLINKQGRVYSAAKIEEDKAREPLFTWVDEERILAKDTYKKFHCLLDNYVAQTGEAETVTQEEVKENIEFIDAIMDTDIMVEAHKFLVSKGKAPSDAKAFEQLLYDTWFKLYRRTKGDRDYDSSGFEHVFVGELKEGKVIGFHNWIQLYIQEKKGNLDYKGHFKWGTDKGDDPRMLTLQFSWEGEEGEEDMEKAKGSSFLGTSPEFEIAMYTVCFLLGRSDPSFHILIDNFWKVELKVHRIGPHLGTAYPIAR